MRRLLRWTFNTLATASLLLCLATAGLWVRSYWVYDEFYAERRDMAEEGAKSDVAHFECMAISYHGRFGGWIAWSERPGTPPWEFEFKQLSRLTADLWSGFGFGNRHRILGGYGYTEQTWTLPDWSLVSAFAVLPAIFTFRQVRAVRRRRHRSRLGLCLACGYDLRASPGRCPECDREQAREVRRQQSEVSEGVLGPHPSDL